MSAFHFLRPWWLITLLPAALIAYQLLRHRRSQSAWMHVCDPALLPHLWLQPPGAKSRLPVIALGLGWALAVVALAGPTWEKTSLPLYHVRTARVLVLDMSPSMNAADVAPSRLTRAQFKIADILKQGQEGMTGLIVFGGEAHLVTPLTRDIATIFNLMQSLSTDLMPVKGSAAAPALAMAGNLLKEAGARDGQIILLTDGVSDMAASLDEVRALREDGYTVSVLGAGTELGAPIPGAGSGNRAAMARLRLDALAELAKIGNGVYLPVTAGDSDLAGLFTAATHAEMAERAEASNGLDQWMELGPWLLPVMLIFAALGFRRGWLIGMVLTVLLPGMSAGPAHALEWSDLWARQDQRGARALERGGPAFAADKFKDPAWRGTAYYQAGDYKKAAEAFAEANGPDADYNRGNALAKAGRLEEAAEAYRAALQVRPRDDDALANLNLIEILLQRQNNQQQYQSENGVSQDQPNTGEQKGSHNPQDRQEQQGHGVQTQPQNEDGDRQDNSGNQRKQQTQQGQEGTGRSNRRQPASHPENDEADAARRDVTRGLKQEERTEQDENPQTVPIRQVPQAKDEPIDEMSHDAGDLEGEQWLRQIPDDPSGLLRRKFMLDHLRRQQETQNK